MHGHAPWSVDTASVDIVRVASTPGRLIEEELEVERDWANPDARRYQLRTEEGPCTVEEYVVTLLARRGWSAWHTENRFWTTTAQFLARTYLLTDVRGGRFSLAPAESLAAGMSVFQYERFLGRLICGAAILGEIEAAAEAHRQLPLYFVKEQEWIASGGLDYYLEAARGLLPIFTAEQLVALLHPVYSWDVGPVRGLPDIVGVKGTCLEFVEVKGPSDTLQPAQDACIRFLRAEVGADVRLVRMKEVSQDEKGRSQFYRRRATRRKAEACAAARMQATLGAAVSKYAVPEIPDEGLTGAQLVALIADAQLLGLRFLRQFIQRAAEQVSDVEVDQRVVEAIREALAPTDAQWIPDCIAKYTLGVERRRQRD